MKQSKILRCIGLSMLLLAIEVSNANPPKLGWVEISGDNVEAINSAMNVFRKHDFDLKNYTVIVRLPDASNGLPSGALLVGFVPNDFLRRNGANRHLGLEVLVRSSDKKILEWDYSK
jgi:hypothetical protein